MDTLFYIVMMLIVFNCAMKLSLWPFWQRLVFSLLLGAFAIWSINYAVEQSKVEIESWFHREDILKTMAIVVTIESAIGLIYCFSFLNGNENKRRKQFMHRLLHYYPGLLTFPVVFFGLTKILFLHVGMDFSTTGILFALAVVVILNLCVELAKRLLPANGLRVEAHLWLTVMVCLLCLFLSETSKIIYPSNAPAPNWTSMILTLLAAALVVAIGFVVNHVKWKLRNRA